MLTELSIFVSQNRFIRHKYCILFIVSPFGDHYLWKRSSIRWKLRVLAPSQSPEWEECSLSRSGMLPSLTCLLPQGPGMRLLGTRLCRGEPKRKDATALTASREKGLSGSATIWGCAKPYQLHPRREWPACTLSGVTGGVGGTYLFLRSSMNISHTNKQAT